MKHFYYLWIVLLFLFGCSSVSENKSSSAPKVVLLTNKQQYTAGENIVLVFEIKGDETPMLLLKNAFGTSIIAGNRINNGIEYRISSHYSNKIGECYWSLIYNENNLASGEIYIKPNESKTVVIETYIGPPSIIAGVTDYTMLVNVPTDIYDNPLEEGNSVVIKHQTENTITTSKEKIKNLIAWKNIYSTKKSGRILISASCNTIDSKELTTIIFPANAIDFKIEYDRVHTYADGNQVINFITSKITDEFNNVVSNGTLVNFIIEDTKGAKLQAIGTTLNGIATAKMLHPSEKETWKITAYITGAAQSDNVFVEFDTAVENITLSFYKDNRTITVGPIKSFMNQLIPDGIHISCAIYDEGHQLIETKKTTSRKGLGSFYLDSDFYKKGKYHVKINSMGLLKEHNIILNE